MGAPVCRCAEALRSCDRFLSQVRCIEYIRKAIDVSIAAGKSVEFDFEAISDLMLAPPVVQLAILEECTHCGKAEYPVRHIAWIVSP